MLSNDPNSFRLRRNITQHKSHKSLKQALLQASNSQFTFDTLYPIHKSKFPSFIIPPQEIKLCRKIKLEASPLRRSKQPSFRNSIYKPPQKQAVYVNNKPKESIGSTLGRWKTQPDDDSFIF